MKESPQQLIQQREEQETRSKYTDRDVTAYVEFLGLSLKKMKGKTVLDIGSGRTEKFSKQAANLGIKVVSLNPKLINPNISKNIKQPYTHVSSTVKADGSVKYKYKTIPWQERSVAARAQELSFSDGSFDYVVALFSAPMYLPQNKEEYENFLKELVRVLKPGGKAHLFPIHTFDNKELTLSVLKEFGSSISVQFSKQKLPGIVAYDEERLIITKLNSELQ